MSIQYQTTSPPAFLPSSFPPSLPSFLPSHEKSLRTFTSTQHTATATVNPNRIPPKPELPKLTPHHHHYFNVFISSQPRFNLESTHSPLFYHPYVSHLPFPLSALLPLHFPIPIPIPLLQVYFFFFILFPSIPPVSEINSSPIPLYLPPHNHMHILHPPSPSFT